MSDVVLKNIEGTEETYKNVNQVVLMSATGEAVVYTEGTGGNGSSVQADYAQNDSTQTDYIKNRPFYNISYQDTYDFTITPEVYFDGLGFRWYKFSELTPTEEQLLTAEFVESGIDSTGNNITKTETPTVERFILSNEEVTGFITAMGSYVVARKAGTIVTDLATVDVPETGIYFGWNTESVPADAQLVVSVKYGELKQIDSQFLPEISWNNLTERPFYDETKVYYEYSEGYEPLESILVNEEANTYIWKISDTPITYDEALGVKAITMMDSDGDGVLDEIEVETAEADLTVEGDCITGNTFISCLSDTTLDGFSLTKGLWTAYSPTTYVVRLYKENVVKIPEKYLPEISSLPEVTTNDNDKILKVVDGAWQLSEDNSSSSGSNTQPDWSVNDETDSAFIKNRPFYKGESIWENILPSTTFLYSYDTNMNMYGFNTSSISDDIITAWYSDWELAKIIWDDIEYICEPQYYEGIKCIGDMGMLITGTRTEDAAPFIFAIMQDGTFKALVSYSLDEETPEDTTVENTTTHTVAASLLMQNIHTLDPKFIKSVEWGKVTGKPFGIVSAGSIVVEEKTITVNNLTPDEEIVPLSINVDNIVNDAPYVVTINGEVYEGIGMVDEDMAAIKILNNSGSVEAGIADIFNGLVISSDTPEIFTTTGDYTIKITLYEDAIKQIDSKFLPATYSYYNYQTHYLGTTYTQTLYDDNVNFEAALNNGGVVKIKFDFYNNGNYNPEVTLIGAKDESNSIFTAKQEFLAGDNIYTFNLNYNFSTNVMTTSVTESSNSSGSSLPTVTTDDNGKILQVEEGDWVIKEMPSSLPTVSTSDNGKLLQVVDGVWTAVTITDGNEVAY